MSMSTRGYLAAILTSTAVVVLCTYYYKGYIKRTRKAKGCVGIDVFDEPHMRDEVKLLRYFNGNTSCWLPGYINATMLTQAKEFPVDDSDIFAVSFPKSGNCCGLPVLFVYYVYDNPTYEVANKLICILYVVVIIEENYKF